MAKQKLIEVKTGSHNLLIESYQGDGPEKDYVEIILDGSHRGSCRYSDLAEKLRECLAEVKDPKEVEALLERLVQGLVDRLRGGLKLVPD